MRKYIAGLVLLAAVFAGTFGALNAQNTNSNANANANSSPSPSDSGDPAVKVWVNKSSKVYHCPTSRYYGKTKSGEYLTQKEAQDAGNKPAGGKVCN